MKSNHRAQTEKYNGGGGWRGRRAGAIASRADSTSPAVSILWGDGRGARAAGRGGGGGGGGGAASVGPPPAPLNAPSSIPMRRSGQRSIDRFLIAVQREPEGATPLVYFASNEVDTTS